MKVWVVCDPREGHVPVLGRVLAVFGSEEKAKSFVRKFLNKNPNLKALSIYTEPLISWHKVE